MLRCLTISFGNRENEGRMKTQENTQPRGESTLTTTHSPGSCQGGPPATSSGKPSESHRPSFPPRARGPRLHGPPRERASGTWSRSRDRRGFLLLRQRNSLGGGSHSPVQAGCFHLPICLCLSPNLIWFLIFVIFLSADGLYFARNPGDMLLLNLQSPTIGGGSRPNTYTTSHTVRNRPGESHGTISSLRPRSYGDRVFYHSLCANGR